MRINLKFYLIPLALLTFIGVSSPVAHAQSAKKYKVVLDPGHGGKDWGTRGAKVKEKDVVLSVSKKVGEYLEQYTDDIEVIFTRKEDKFIELDQRPVLANQAEADLFVSIHANAMPKGNSHIFGTETYVMGTKNEGRNFEVAKRENSVILLEEDYAERYQGFDPESPEVSIMFEIMQEAYQENSILLAQNIEEQFEKRAGRRSRGVKQSSLWVLWNTAMPSVLVEIGYLSNPKEERELASTEVQEYIASAIFRAIRDYFEFQKTIDN